MTEARAFVVAALVEPTPRDHREPDRAFRRRRIVSALTLVVGAGVLTCALHLPPGNNLFYLATVILAAVWTTGALASGPLHLGNAWTRDGTTRSRAVVQSLALGVILVALFTVGALAVAHLPPLRMPLDALLAHASEGSLPLVALITAANGVAEELYFRGALYAGVGRRHAVAVTTVIYILVTAASGVVLLSFAAAVLGLVVGLQRRVTGGILGPVITHLVWSLSMLFVLPSVLAVAS
ncbi:CPBP family intramembrane glutamic endopeptidase [Leekyejoonella antrihumi]|uniref:CPBP family intramembrane glutamic endopeptidase n=1 Tax=Leekyejoonella antrihumi TaxID=1660198 RepID=UPI001FE760D1|nr:CPBP family intramembrane glutamic endopeptidase [Leekyejoonella antrihumi]